MRARLADATFSGAHYMRWTNPEARFETPNGLTIDWPSLRPVLHEAVATASANAANAANGEAGGPHAAAARVPAPLPGPMVERRRRTERRRRRRARRGSIGYGYGGADGVA